MGKLTKAEVERIRATLPPETFAPDRVSPNALMTTIEVARAFGVERTTVHKWADAGLLTAIRTLGGVRRYLRPEVEALVAKADYLGTPPGYVGRDRYLHRRGVMP